MLPYRYEHTPQAPAQPPSMPVGAIPTATLYAELRRRRKPVTPEETVEFIARLEAELEETRAVIRDAAAAALAEARTLRVQVAVLREKIAAWGRWGPAQSPVSDFQVPGRPPEPAGAPGRSLAVALAAPGLVSGPVAYNEVCLPDDDADGRVCRY